MGYSRVHLLLSNLVTQRMHKSVEKLFETVLNNIKAKATGFTANRFYLQ